MIRWCNVQKNRIKESSMRILSIMPINGKSNFINRDNCENTNNTNCMCRPICTTKVNFGFNLMEATNLPPNFAEVIKGKLFVGGAPTDKQLEIYKEGGITLIINMCKEAGERIAIRAKKLEMDYRYQDRYEVAKQDYQEGTPLYVVLQLIKKELNKPNGKVIITCDKGEAASRGLAKQYLIKVEGMSLEDAMEKLPTIFSEKEGGAPPIGFKFFS